MLKAVLFDFNGVIIDDEEIHRSLVDEILLSENLLPLTSVEYYQFALGRSDKSCFRDLFAHRGRSLSEDYLTRLIKTKAELYRQKLLQYEILPVYAGLKTFLDRLSLRPYVLGLVTGSVRSEVLYVLEQSELMSYFPVIVTGDDVLTSKPDPDGYLQAVELWNQQDPLLQLSPQDCLVIEDTFAGIEAAKRAGMSVVAIANTYPYHFMQRYGNWAVDRLSEIDLDRIEVVMARRSNADD